MKLKKRRDRLAIFIASIIIFDQFTKSFIVDRLYLVCNKSVAFGVVNLNLIFFVILLFLLLMLLVFERRTINVISLGLILGGGISNVIDRLLYGCVRDFIDFKIFPVFNFADVVLTVGAFMMIYGYMERKRWMN